VGERRTGKEGREMERGKGKRPESGTGGRTSRERGPTLKNLRGFHVFPKGWRQTWKEETFATADVPVSPSPSVQREILRVCRNTLKGGGEVAVGEAGSRAHRSGPVAELVEELGAPSLPA
jgi:hypothetical protein